MATSDLDRIRFISGNLEHLQGLRMVVLGGWMLAVVALDGLADILLATAVAGIAHGVVDRYYARRYGRARGSSMWDLGLRDTPTWMVAAGALTMVAAGVVDATVLGDVRVSAVGIAGAVWTVAINWPARRFRPHWIWLALFIGAVSVTPPLYDVALRYAGDGDVFGAKLDVLMVAIGAGSVVVGLIDHVLLRRDLPAVDDPSDPAPGEGGA